MRAIVVALFLVVSLCSSAQTEPQKVLSVKVWDAVFVPSGNHFWSQVETQVAGKLSSEKIKELKSFSIATNWPYGLFETEDMLDDEYEEWTLHMNQLKFQTLFSIKIDGIVYYILELPYSINSNWDKRYFWKNSLYFFFQDKYLNLSH